MFVKTTVFVTQHPTSIRERERERASEERVKGDAKERKRIERERANAVVCHFSIIKTSDV